MGLFEPWHIIVILIALFILMIPLVCGFLGYKEGKKRTIGSTAGLLLGIFLGPLGLIIVYLTEKMPLQKNGGIRV